MIAESCILRLTPAKPPGEVRVLPDMHVKGDMLPTEFRVATCLLNDQSPFTTSTLL